MSGNIVATRGVTGRPLDILLWCVQASLAFVFASASWPKLMGTPEMVELFTAVGIGQWFRYLTGILELTGAVLIVVPKTRSIGAALLATVMLGALAAHLLILHVPPTMPAVLMLLSGFVVWGRRGPSPNLAPAVGDESGVAGREERTEDAGEVLHDLLEMAPESASRYVGSGLDSRRLAPGGQE